MKKLKYEYIRKLLLFPYRCSFILADWFFHYFIFELLESEILEVNNIDYYLKEVCRSQPGFLLVYSLYKRLNPNKTVLDCDSFDNQWFCYVRLSVLG